MRHTRGRTQGQTRREPDETRLLAALQRAGLDQPVSLTRRHGILNLYWLAVEELGTRRGPCALEALVARGLLRRDPACPEIGRVTPAGIRVLHATAA
jgi:hypothetical protein